jgi:hypothetical protein
MLILYQTKMFSDYCFYPQSIRCIHIRTEARNVLPEA